MPFPHLEEFDNFLSILRRHGVSEWEGQVNEHGVTGRVVFGSGAHKRLAEQLQAQHHLAAGEALTPTREVKKEKRCGCGHLYHQHVAGDPRNGCEAGPCDPMLCMKGLSDEEKVAAEENNPVKKESP